MRTIILILTGGSLLAAQIVTIRARVDMVVVPATVLDSRGRVVTNLTVEDFQLREDGKAQVLTDASVDTIPPAVELIRDSGLALAGFANSEKMFMAFSESFKKEQDDQAEPRMAVTMNDALYAAAESLDARPRERRKVIVGVVTAAPVGGRPAQAVIDRLVSSQIQIFYVLVGHFFPLAPTSILHSYADPTGGDVFRATDDRQMSEVLARITDLLRHQYVLSYVSNNALEGSQSVSRRIEVKTLRPGLKITHRRKYVQLPPQ